MTGTCELSPKVSQRRLPLRSALAPIVLVALAVHRPALAQSAPQVPLVTGLTIVSALHFPEGDRENIVRVTEASDSGVHYQWYYKQHGGIDDPRFPDRAVLKRYVRTRPLP